MNWELGGAAKWINPAMAHEEATCAGYLDSKTSSRNLIVLLLILICLPSFLISNDVTTVLCFAQNKCCIDYDDPSLVQAKIGDAWWLTHNTCKYLLCCLVMKGCKDISMRPCKQPAGKSRVVAREAKVKAIGEERALAKSERPVEKNGNIDHQMKKAQVVGMQAPTEKILVDTIQIQIKNLRENADVYKSIHGEQGYNELLVSLINKITGTNQSTEMTPSSAAVSSRDGAISLLDENQDE
jgi:hypothetical protein